MDVFSALSDPTRRSIVELLARRGPLTASDIYDQFQVSRPAVSQHLKVLREAGLVQVEKRAQQRIYKVNPQAVQQVEDWAGRLTRLWEARFDALERVLEAEKQRVVNGERSIAMTDSIGRQVSFTRIYDAPRELVYKAWTDPQLLAQWWGPAGFDNPLVEMDVRPGGSLRIHMRGPDQTVYPMTGTFREIVPDERLVFVSSALAGDTEDVLLEDITTVTFEDAGEKTRVTVHAVVTKAVPEAAGALAGMEEGWNQSLDRLAAVLQKTRHDGAGG